MDLILTADRRFWPPNLTKDTVLLGKWCLLDLQPSEQIVKNAKILPYVFDHEDPFRAYQQVRTSYQRLFPHLAENLNAIHGTSHGKRYWELIVGYWFMEFLGIVHERFRTLKQAKEMVPNADVILLNKNSYYCPQDGRNFSRLYLDDLYNQQLYGEIIHFIGGFSIKERSLSRCDWGQYNPTLHVPRVIRWKNAIKWLSLLFSKWNRIYIVSSYLPVSVLIKVALRLKIFPTLDTPHFEFTTKELDRQKRNCLGGFPAQDEFEQLIQTMIGNHLPLIFIENFDELTRTIKMFFPTKKVDLILTANGFAVNDGFKVWAASQVEQHKTPYVVAQHGGNYGCALWNSSEDHETDIADYYLTYGWNDVRKKNIIPFFANRIPASVTHRRPGNDLGPILWVLNSVPRYSYIMFSFPMGPQFDAYIEDQILFLKALDLHSRKILRCRPPLYEYGWRELHRIKNSAGEVTLSNFHNSIWKEMKNARLVISTYNATAHLETFTANIPTILYWNPKHWKLRPEALPIHKKMHSLGILHEDPVSAAHKVNAIRDSVSDWWMQSEIQKCRQGFCSQFARISSDPAQEWIRLIKKLSSKE